MGLMLIAVKSTAITPRVKNGQSPRIKVSPAGNGAGSEFVHFLAALGVSVGNSQGNSGDSGDKARRDVYALTAGRLCSTMGVD